MVNCELKVKGKIFVDIDSKKTITVKDVAEVDLSEDALIETKVDLIYEISKLLDVPTDCVIISDFEVSCVEVKE